MTTLPPPVADLSAWIGQTLASDDQRAAAVLSAATNLVHSFTGRDWSATDAPAEVADLVVRVAARVYLSPANPNVRSQGAGPFTEAYFDTSSAGLALTADEQAALGRYITGNSGIGTISTTRGDGTDGTVYVPTGPAPSGYPFPWYAADGY